MSLDRESALDAAVRLRAFEFLTEQRWRFGELPLPRAVLDRGFDFEVVRVPLVGPQGIFKPAVVPVIRYYTLFGCLASASSSLTRTWSGSTSRRSRDPNPCASRFRIGRRLISDSNCSLLISPAE